MAEKDQQLRVKRKDSNKFTWRIENFSKLTETRVYSDPFLVGAHRWGFLVYPKGNKQEDYQSLYLYFADEETMPPGWSVLANVVFTLVDHIQIITTAEFQKGITGLGYGSFAPLEKLCTKWFLVDDTLLIEARVSIEWTLSEAATTAYEHAVIEESKTLSPEVQIDSLAKTFAELPTITISPGNNDYSSSSDGVSCSTQQLWEKKLETLFSLPLESLHETELIDEVALEILALTPDDPLQKTVANDIISRLKMFKEVVPNSLSTIETSLAIESTKAHIARYLEERLAHRKTQLACLEAEASRLAEQGSKLDVEIQWLTARKAKIDKHMNSTTMEMVKAVREASEDLNELKKEHEEMKEAGEKRMRAVMELALASESWMIFSSSILQFE